MARQQRNDVDYFPHPVSHGKSMFYLRTKYGNDGYTVWFMILEKLGAADFHFLDLKDEIQLMYLSAELKVSDEDLTSIIQDLVRMGKFDAQLWNQESIVYDQEFVDSIADAYKKRTNTVINKEALLLRLTDIGRLKGSLGSRKPPKPDLKGSGNPQRIEEDTKEEDTKSVSEPKYKIYYREQWELSKGHALASKYQHLVKYIMNIDANIIGEPGLHILKLKKQLSFDQFVDLTAYCDKRTTSIKEMIDSWLNTPAYSKGKVSVYANLQTWARKAPIQGTNFQDNKKPLIRTNIGKS